MYTIIGSDGKQYGPVDLNTLRQWAADGRANADTSVQRVGTTEWRRLATVPELASAIEVPTSAGGPPPTMPRPAPMESGPTKTSGLAITSLVLALLSPLCSLVTALPGLIFGIVALNKIKKSHGMLTGKGLAIAGIVLSAVMMLVNIALVGLLIPAIGSARGKARQTMCLNNVKQIGMALAQYSVDFGDTLPEAEWNDRIMNYAGSKQIFKCPEAPDGSFSYAFNSNMLGQKWQDDVDAVVVVEYTGPWNGTVTGPEQLIIPPHRGVWTVLYNDGHVNQVSKRQLDALHWKPVVVKKTND